ncbi:hypothetical protein KQI63_09555 [bacterium]|nr:hypothetical protein [bacterium]
MKQRNQSEITHDCVILTPLGFYPLNSFIIDDVGYIANKDICYCIIPNDKSFRHDPYSDMQIFRSKEVVLYSALLLAIPDQQGINIFYPDPDTIALSINNIKMTEGWFNSFVTPIIKKHIVNERKGTRRRYSPVEKLIYRTPLIGGRSYEYRDDSNVNNDAQNLYCQIDKNNKVLMRGLYALLKSNMLHVHRMFLEEATMMLYISMESSRVLVLDILKKEGINKPTYEDAAKYIYDVFGGPYALEGYFKYDFNKRAVVVHPKSKFGRMSYPDLEADDYYDLFDDMRSVYKHIVEKNGVI